MRPLFLLGLGLAALAACDEGRVTPPQPNFHGELRFSYSGDRSGVFVAEGEVDGVGGVPAYGTWAYGTVTQAGVHTVFAFEGQAEPNGDLLLLRLGVLDGPGDYTLSAASCGNPGGLEACRIGNLALDVDVDVLRGNRPVEVLAEHSYLLTSGVVQVLSTSRGRLRGTFEGTALLEGDDDAEVRIVDGSFDVPVAPQ